MENLALEENDVAAIKDNDNKNKSKTDTLSHAMIDVEVDSPDGKSNYGDRSSTIKSIQHICRLITENFIMKILILILVLIDIAIVIAIISSKQDKERMLVLDALSIGFSCLFMLEVLLRIIGLGPKTFFDNWINVVDCLIVLITLIVNVVTFCLIFSPNPRLISLLRFIRLPRVLHLIRIIFAKDSFINSGRHVTSENKRRYRLDGYDLDLCYITDRIIAMSFPSNGLTALYRNHISDVAKFLNERYGTGYRVYNLCEERGYDESKFNNQVERYYIRDHNVPRLEEMIQFGESSRRWLSGSYKKRNKNKLGESHRPVIAVHCRGGKGRTGTMVCVAMMECGLLDGSGEKALEYFGARRTDKRLGSKFQGVDTPSQGRFVRYYADLRNSHPLKLASVPPERPLQLISIKIFDIANIGKGDGSDLNVQIIQAIQWPIEKQNSSLNKSHCSDSESCNIYHITGYYGEREQLVRQLYGSDYTHTSILTSTNQKEDIRVYEMKLSNETAPIIIDREIKIKFDFIRPQFQLCAGGGVNGGHSNYTPIKYPPSCYDNCAFFCWFHTYFVPSDNSMKLYFDREELDNPHKKKLWKYYGPNFGVEFQFQEVTTNNNAEDSDD